MDSLMCYENLSNNRCGKVKEIQLQNFLVHQNIKIQFGLNFNLIVGANGSGKSAIASGLAVCLGGRGSQAGRQTTSLKEYIRFPPNGEEQLPALVSVDFVNTGEHAYERDTFGDTVTVERRINLDGTSKFRIGGERKKLKVVNKSEVDAYSAAVSIDMSNVAVYLTQDSAKKLLKSSSATDFYRFFEETLKVDVACVDQQQTFEKVMKAENSLSEAKKIYESGTLHFENSKKQVESFEQRLKLKEEEERLRCLIHWTKVKETANDYQMLRNRHSEMATAIDTMALKINELRREINNEQEKEHLRQEDIKNRLAEKELEREQMNKCAKHEVEVEYTKAKEELMLLRKAEEDMKLELHKLNSDKRELQQEADTTIDVEENKKLELQHLMSALDIGMQQLERDVETLEAEGDGKANFHDEKQRLDAMMIHDREELTNARLRLQELDKRDDHKTVPQIFTQRFSYDFRNVREAVRRDRRFSARPVGPVAAYIYASDRLLGHKEMHRAVETYMNKYLSHWLVPNHNDQRLLEAHLKDVGQKMPEVVILSEFHTPRPWDTRSFQRSSNLTYVLDLLNIPDPNVKNYLIQKTFIESTAIFFTFSEMYSAVKNENLRLRRGLEVESGRYGIRFGGGSAIEIPPASKLRFDDHLIGRQGKMSEKELKEQKEGAIRHANETIDSLQRKLKSMEDEMVQLQQNERQNTEVLTSKKTKLNRLSERKRRYESALEDVEVEIRSRIGKRRKLAEESGTRLKDLEDEVRHQATIVAKAAAAVQSQAKEVDKHEYRIKEAELKIQEKQTEIQKLQIALNAPFECRHTMTLAELVREQDQTESLMTELIVALQDKQEEYEDAEKEALDYRKPSEEEMNNGVSVEAIRDRLDQVVSQLILGEDLAEAEVQGLRQQLAFAAQSRDTSKRSLLKIEEIIQSGKALHAQLTDKINNIVETAALKATAFFNREMQTISRLQPRMEFKHPSKEIHFFTRKSQMPADLNTLSGGERASLQAGLLMALAESSDSPFHFFDEFDVFMDAATRAEIMKLLFEFAKRNTHRQFVLCTPHAVETFFENERRALNDENFEFKVFNMSLRKEAS